MKQLILAITVCNIVDVDAECKGCDTEYVNDPIGCQDRADLESSAAWSLEKHGAKKGCAGWSPHWELEKMRKIKNADKTKYKDSNPILPQSAAGLTECKEECKPCNKKEQSKCDWPKGYCLGCEGYIFEEEACNEQIKAQTKKKKKKKLPYDTEGKECIQWIHIDPEIYQKTQSEKEQLNFKLPQDLPEIHEMCADHCAFTAAYSIARNLLDIQWTPKDWNVKAGQVDEIYKNILKGHNEKRMHRHSNWLGVGNEGVFREPFVQMMLKTVGLSYAILSEHTAAVDVYDDSMAQITPNRRWAALGSHNQNEKPTTSEDEIYDMIIGKKKFKNSKGQLKPMVGMIIAVNGYPFLNRKKYIKRDTFNSQHNVAFFKWIDGNYYYIDSNVHHFKAPTKAWKSPFPLCNIYHGEPIPISKDVEVRKKSGWPEGYLVDWSLKLGNDAKGAAKWLYEKLEIRPQGFDEHNHQYTDSAGAYWYSVVVEGDVESWDDQLSQHKKLLERYTKSGMKKKLKWLGVALATDIDDDNYYEYDEYKQYEDDIGYKSYGELNQNSEYFYVDSNLLEQNSLVMSVFVAISIFVCICGCIGLFVGYFARYLVDKME